MNKELTVQEAALAWAQGKKVEAASRLIDPECWKQVDEVGVDNPNNSTHYAGVFNSPDVYSYRLAPDPPAKRYRPWMPDEVPLGAQIRAIGMIWRGLILAVSANREIECVTGFLPLEYAFANHEHSTDNGKTWLPCGVEVES